MFARSLIMSVLSAAVVGSAFPAAALVLGPDADGDKVELAAAKKDESEKSEKKDKGDRAKSFPMKGDEFKTRIDARLSKAREKLETLLEKRKVEEEQRRAALKRFDDGAVKVRAAAERAGKDGTVTVEEAKEVRAVAKAERKAMKGAVAERPAKKGKKAKKA